MPNVTIPTSSFISSFQNALSKAQTAKGAEGISPPFSWKEAGKTNVIVEFFCRIFGMGDSVDAKAKMGDVFEAALNLTPETSFGAKTDLLERANIAVKWLDSKVSAEKTTPFRLKGVRGEDMVRGVAEALGLRDRDTGDLTQAGMRMIVNQILSDSKVETVPFLSSIMEANQKALDAAISEGSSQAIQLISGKYANKDTLEDIAALFKSDMDRNTGGDMVYTLGGKPLLDDAEPDAWHDEQAMRHSYKKTVYSTVTEALERASGGNAAILKTLTALYTQQSAIMLSGQLDVILNGSVANGKKGGRVQVELDTKGVAIGGTIEHNHRASSASPIYFVSGEAGSSDIETTTGHFKATVDFSIGSDGMLTFRNFTHSIQW